MMTQSTATPSAAAPLSARADQPRRHWSHKGLWSWVGYALLILLSILWLFPIFWILLTSVKPDPLIPLMPPVWNFIPTLDHYANLGVAGSFPQYCFNSATIAVSATVIAVLVSAPAAYSIVRFHTGGDGIKLWILGSRMIPPVIIAVPMFVIFQSVGLSNSLLGLILVHSAALAPFCAWLMVGFIQAVPREIEEAGLIDGCSTLDVLRRITLPLIRPGLASTAVLALVISWNDLFYALVLSNGNTKTLPVAVTSFITGYNIKWGDLSAASVVMLVPPVILALLVQKELVRGLTLGGVK
jgi:multiple sugar transport system permease protein